VGRSLIAAVVLLAVAGEARADELAFHEPPEIPRARPMRQQLAEAFDDIGATLDEHLGILTNDVLDLELDTLHKRGRVRIRGETSRAAVDLDSDIQWRKGGAHVSARIALRLGDHEVEIEIPEFEVRPTTVDGERGVEVRVPLITGTF
jgi:hypothetical protein